jgi:hypothetical protein
VATAASVSLTDEQPGARVEDVGHEPRRLVPTAELQRFVDERHRLLVAALLMRLREHVQPVGEQPTSSSLPRTRPTGLGENLDGVVRGAEACEQASCCTSTRAADGILGLFSEVGRVPHAPTALPCSSAACSAGPAAPRSGRAIPAPRRSRSLRAARR